MQRILEKILIGVLFLVPLVPFVMTGSMFFPFITGKAFAFRFIVGAVLALWSVLLLYNKSYAPKKSLVLYVVLVFFGIVALADIFGAHFQRSLWSNFERMEGLVTFLYLCAFFVVSSTVLTRTKKWAAFWNTSVIASGVMGVYAVLQVLGILVLSQGGTRVDATLGNSIYLAVYMLFHIFITLWFLYTQRSSRMMTIVYTVALVLQFTALYYTGTRGTMLGLLGGLGLTAVLVLWRGAQHPRLRKLSLWVVIGIVGLVGLFFTLRNTSFVQGSDMLRRFTNVSVLDGTVQSRLILWSGIAKEGFLERPILGWGQDNFIVVFGKYYDPRMYQQEPWFDRAHNVFFDWLISAGLLGLLAYLSLFAVSLITLWRPTTALSVPERALFTGLFAGYFVHNIFVFDNLISYIFFFACIGFVESFSYARQSVVQGKNEVQPLLKDDSVRMGTALLSAGVIIFLVYATTVPHITASRSLISALQSQADLPATLAYFDRALKDPVGREETRLQLSRVAFNVAVSNAPDEAKQAFLSRAYTEARLSLQEDPMNTRPKYFLAVFEARLGNFAEAQRLFEELLAFNPNRQMFLNEYGSILQLQGKFTEAIDVFEKLVTLAPETQEYGIHYAALLFAEKKVTDATAFIESTFGTQTAEFVSADYRQGEMLDYTSSVESISFNVLRGTLLKNENINDYLMKINELSVAGRKDEALQLIDDAADSNAEFAKGVPTLRTAVQNGEAILQQQ